MARPPVFLQRRSYRARRMMDAVRLLPLLGLALWMVPLMWPVPVAPSGGGSGMPMSIALRYLFGVWGLLVIAGVALWWRTRATARDLPADENT